MERNRDFLLLARRFETFEFAKDQKYLLKYFETPVQRLFLKYFFTFGDYEHFTAHTGVPCQPAWLLYLKRKLTHIQTAHSKAKADMDMTKLARIEAGGFAFKSEA